MISAMGRFSAPLFQLLFLSLGNVDIRAFFAHILPPSVLTYNSIRLYTQYSRREHSRQGGCPHVLTYEYKLDGTKKQCQAIDEAIRIVQFIRNKCLRKWMDERG